MKKRTVRKLEIVLHLLTVLMLLLKGLEEISVQLYFPGIIILGFALTILAILLFWKPFRIPPKAARVTCFYIESPALLFLSFVLYRESKEFMPYIFFTAAFMYMAAGFISSKKFRKLRKHAL